MTPLDDIGQAVAKARKALKLTQEQTARYALVSRPTLAALENGRIRELGYHKLARILTVVGLELRIAPAGQRRPTLDDLIAENEEEDRQNR